jgi:hypothetical protein
VYTQQPQVVVQQPVLDNPPGDQFIMSLFTTFCCFMPFGIIALIKSMEARNAYQNGRHEDSAAAIRSAKAFNKWAIITNFIILGVVLVIQIAWIIPVIILAVVNANDETKND